MTAIAATALSQRAPFSHFLFSLLSLAAFAYLPSSQAQQSQLPYGSDTDQKRYAQIRAKAQQDQQEAQVAALRRRATQSSTQSNRDKVLEQARLDKEFKRRAALALQQQQSIDAYKKVKQSEIDSWKGKGKISPGVPNEFLNSLPPLEENDGKKRGIFGGMKSASNKAAKGLASLRPGFLSGKKKKKQKATQEAPPQFAPVESLTLQGVAPRAPQAPVETNNEPVEQPKKKGFRIPLVSKLTGGKNKDENPYINEVDSLEPETQQTWQEAYPDPNESKKKGFLKGFSSLGKKKKEDPDAYYGPIGPDESIDTAEIEGEKKSSFLSKLSLKKNKKSEQQDSGMINGGASTESRDNIYIVDAEQAQFFPFGKSEKQAGSQSLNEGTLVRMTKSGDDWSSIELSSGSMGVIRNKQLRRAKASEVPTNMFAHKSVKTYPTTARINKIRSATGKGATHRYTEPVNVPLPDLPEGGNETLIGNGLLPPLEGESTIQ